MSFKSAFAVALGVGFALAACSSDEERPPPISSGGSGGSSASGGAAGGGAGGGGEAGAPELIDVCTNASDTAARDTVFCVGAPVATGPEQRMTSTEAMSGCGVICATAANQEECALNCFKGATENAFSNDCSNCYVNVTLCLRDHCLNECLGKPFSEDCMSCRCGDNDEGVVCEDVFTKCAGWESTQCEDLAAGTWTPNIVDGLCADGGVDGGSDAGGAGDASSDGGDASADGGSDASADAAEAGADSGDAAADANAE